MDTKMSVCDRLVIYAENGYVGCSLNLYNRQIEKLVREGLAVQRGMPVPGWKGQYRCKIGWRYAYPGTIAWRLLEIAADNNPALRKILGSLEENEFNEFGGGWLI